VLLLELPDVLLLVGAAVLLVELVVIVHRWPAIGIWLFGGVAMATSLGLGRVVVMETIQVSALDYAILVLLGALGRGLLVGRRLSMAVVVLLALLGLALLRGIADFGLETAVNAGRELLYVLVGVAFVTVCAPRQAWPAIQRLWTVAGAVFLGIAVVFLVRHGLGTYAVTGERALSASQALIVAQAGVIALGRPGRWYPQAFAFACFGVVLASQQRTVWAAAAIAVLVLALKASPLGAEHVSPRVRVAVSVAVVGVLVLMAIGPAGLRESVSKATSTVSTTSGTFGWRIDGWEGLVRSYGERPITDQAVGQPGGAGFDREVGGGLVTVSPHNMYLTVLLALGAVGLVALLVLYAEALRATVRTNPRLHALVWSLVVFSIGYQIAAEDALILGAALAAPALTPARTRAVAAP